MKNKSELVFLPADERTKEEIQKDIENRNKKIEQDIVGIMEAWAKFKSDLKDIENRKKMTDYKVYTYCFAGIAVCTILLLILELAK